MQSGKTDWFDDYTDTFLGKFVPIANSLFANPDLLRQYMTDYLEWYFIQHYERIKLTVELLKCVVKPHDEILDLGSIFPLSTYWFYLNRLASVTCADICASNWKVSDSLKSTTVDLNKIMLDRPDGWPVINFQEVIEHLTCNLKEARDRIVNAVRPGGYLLAGYPIVNMAFSLNGMPVGSSFNVNERGKISNRPGFEATLKEDNIADHKREFLYEECEGFFPLKVVASKTVFTVGYTRGTVLVLYRRD